MQHTTTTLADQVFNQVQQAIVQGQFAPGQRLSEAELSRSFGCSRVPLREAIRRLESQGLITRIPHAGIRVATLSAEELLDIYWVREALEGLACKLAAQQMPAEMLRRLRGVLDSHDRSIRKAQGMSYYQSEGDFDFHYLIAKGSGNRRLYEMLCGDLYHRVRMYRFKVSTIEGRPDLAFREHTRIVDALEQRDGEVAEMLMCRHIAAARTTIEKALSEGRLILN